MPNVRAQTTTITNVSYTRTALFNIDTQSTNTPLVLNATVDYSDVKSGYYLAAGVFDLDNGNLVSGLGSSSPQSCITTAQFAGCIISLTGTNGSERMQFLLTHPKGVWNLALQVGLLDKVQNLIPNSFSDYTFTISVTSALTLEVDVPNSVAVSVDGVNGSGGNVQLVLAAGTHTVSVPELVQIDNVTRIEFTNWSDGSTDANRSVALNYDIVLRANYVTQFRLQVTSPVSLQGGGWYNAGSNTTLSVPSRVTPMTGILGALGAKWVFQGWTEDGRRVSESTIYQVSMDSPHRIEVNWSADYILPLLILGSVALILAFTVAFSRRRSQKRKRPKHGKKSKLRRTRRRGGN